MATILSDSVRAPVGFEGKVCWDANVGEYRAFCRAWGDSWWKDCGLVGHASFSNDEIRARAVAPIENHVAAMLAAAEGK